MHLSRSITITLDKDQMEFSDLQNTQSDVWMGEKSNKNTLEDYFGIEAFMEPLSKEIPNSFYKTDTIRICIFDSVKVLHYFRQSKIEIH